MICGQDDWHMNCSPWLYLGCASWGSTTLLFFSFGKYSPTCIPEGPKSSSFHHWYSQDLIPCCLCWRFLCHRLAKNRLASYYLLLALLFFFFPFFQRRRLSSNVQASEVHEAHKPGAANKRNRWYPNFVIRGQERTKSEDKAPDRTRKWPTNRATQYRAHKLGSLTKSPHARPA